MVIELLPMGLRGLMMSVMIAALMSSLTSIFNSASTIFTMDLWRHIRPRSSEWELMIVGRVFVLVLVVVSILWIPIVQASQGGQLFIYIQSISSYLQPPVAVVFIAGCFWKRTNEKGAFWGMTIGLTVGLIRMVLDFVYAAPQCDQPDTRPEIVKYVHYLYLSMILGLLTLVVVVAVSLWTDPPSNEMISRLTWFTRFDSSAASPKETTSPRSTPNSVSETDNITGQPDTTSSDDIFTKTKEDGTSWCSHLKRAILWLCGMDKREGDKHSPEAPDALEPADVLLYEDSTKTRVLNINLILCTSAAVFLWAYFG
ncbi:hypothetical protein GDO86_017541 [Hymenochirus boettgeri]|uniref:Sodium/myo-inositol cotransporter 2 n=1 Tax=Hymenochirus boettgeri TaxID=247094 RepID=A0A8T2IMS9_9PIPI|nr:hypothetical protein GDO86_017541 [Hymenochirus boettgeri]